MGRDVMIEGKEQVHIESRWSSCSVLRRGSWMTLTSGESSQSS